MNGAEVEFFIIGLAFTAGWFWGLTGIRPFSAFVLAFLLTLGALHLLSTIGEMYLTLGGYQ